MSEEYVLDNVTVIKTGRRANKSIAGRGRTPARTYTLFEVKPADPEDGSWTRWVRIEDLYKIEEETNNENPR